ASDFTSSSRCAQSSCAAAGVPDININPPRRAGTNTISRSILVLQNNRHLCRFGNQENRSTPVPSRRRNVNAGNVMEQGSALAKRQLQFIVGMTNSAPSLTPEGQREVTVLVLV